MKTLGALLSFLLLLPALLPAASAPAEKTFPATLSPYDVATANQSYGALQIDKSVSGGALTIGGKIFETGLGTHAVSEIPVTVPVNAARFSGAVGIDDAAGAGHGSVKFRILSGEKILWESPAMKSGDSPLAFDITTPTTLYRKIYLQADSLGDNAYDHADWVNLAWSAGELPAVNPAQNFPGAEFGLTPAAGDVDQTPALVKALSALRTAPGSTLTLAKGEYHFWHTGALRRHFHISNHDQPEWQPVGIPLVDLQNVTIDAAGSTFVFHGLMLPVLFLDSAGVTLKNASIDFARPHHSQATITQVAPDFYEMTIDPKLYPHEIRDGWIVHKGEGWETGDWGFGNIFDGKTREILAGTGDVGFKGKLTVVNANEGRYRVAKKLPGNAKPGDRIMLRHTSRPHPGVVFYRAKNSVLENVNIRQAAGMGVLGQRSENIRITGGGVNIAQGGDRYFTTNADATHFSNCRGEIIVENGLYENMPDDAINVHATCLKIVAKPDSRTIRARYMHGQSVGFEVALPGEALRFIRAKTLENCAPNKVKNVRRLDTNNVEIVFENDIAGEVATGDVVENADWFPAVIFRNNLVRNNRARGTLFTTPLPVLVEKNIFDHSSGSAILLAGDANGWFESGACEDVVIRGNVFKGNLTSDYQFTEALISIYPEVPDLKNQKQFYHRNVRIENNLIETHDVPLIFAISTDGIKFSDNKVTYNNDYPGRKKPPFIFRRCANVVIENNTVHDAAGSPATWTAGDVKAELMPPENVAIKSGIPSRR